MGIDDRLDEHETPVDDKEQKFVHRHHPLFPTSVDVQG
jgi:hypothetical protein